MWAGDFSFYDDPTVTAPYELGPGDETVQNYNAVIVGVTSGRFFYRRQFRGRYGSHHGMVRFAPSTVTKDGWLNSGDVLLTTPEIITLNNAYLDYPRTYVQLPPEEEGIGYRTSSTGAFFNLHHFNASDRPTLRENWVNVWYVPADQVTKEALYFVAQAPVDYPPGMVLDSEGSVAATAETQVLSMVAHRHAWTTRLHAWVVRAGSTQEELVYDSNDWSDMPTFSYNSRVMNPPPGQGMDGATSGPLVLQAGDVLRFNCHIDTTAARAAELGVDAPSTPLRFGNQASRLRDRRLRRPHAPATQLGFASATRRRRRQRIGAIRTVQIRSATMGAAPPPSRPVVDLDGVFKLARATKAGRTSGYRSGLERRRVTTERQRRPVIAAALAAACALRTIQHSAG